MPSEAEARRNIERLSPGCSKGLGNNQKLGMMEADREYEGNDVGLEMYVAVRW